MATSKLAPLPQASIPWVDQQGRPTQPLRQFMTALAAGNIGPLVSAANDAAAAKAGVPINGLYEASGAVRIRLS
jgi:hypothetical protein